MPSLLARALRRSATELPFSIFLVTPAMSLFRASDLPSADVACDGFGFGRTLRAVCGARLARTDRDLFDGFTRSTAYRYLQR